MPELPEVEISRRYLEATSLGRRIASVYVAAPEMVEGISSRSLRSRLEGRRFVRTRRHGKFLFAGLDRGGWLVLHFGMTGDLAYESRQDAAPRHVRLRIDFADGSHLAFADQRKFGHIAFTTDPAAFARDRRLGADPLEPRLDFAAFKTSIARRRGALKPVLLDQRVVAGIGNIYADEILFRTGLHPRTRLERLDDRALRDLHRAILRVLTRAVRAQGDVDRLPRGSLLRQRHAGGRCPKCGRALARVVLGSRGTFYCPHDQQERA